MDDLGQVVIPTCHAGGEWMERRRLITREGLAGICGVAERRRRHRKDAVAAMDGDNGNAGRRERDSRVLRRVGASVRRRSVSTNGFGRGRSPRRVHLRKIPRRASEDRASGPPRINAAIGIASGAFGGGAASDD